MSVADPDAFWSEEAKALEWFSPFSKVSAGSFAEGNVAWFLDGKLNVSHNCVDRHVATKGDEVAIIWESDEPGQGRSITFKELHAEVCKVANAMLASGVKKGDTVAIYLPMVPEMAYAMLACARIGAVHSVVFAGFSAESLRDRIVYANSKCAPDKI